MGTRGMAEFSPPNACDRGFRARHGRRTQSDRANSRPPKVLQYHISAKAKNRRKGCILATIGYMFDAATKTSERQAGTSGISQTSSIRANDVVDSHINLQRDIRASEPIVPCLRSRVHNGV